jgi:hypothetical protein
MIIYTVLYQNSGVIRRFLTSLQIRVSGMRFPAHTETNVTRKEHVKILRNYDDLMRGSQSGKLGKVCNDLPTHVLMGPNY